MKFRIFNYAQDDYTRATVPILLDMSARSFKEAQKADDYNPDIQGLANAWEAGAVRIFLALDDENKPQGFQIWNVGKSFRGTIDATLVSVFLEPAHRNAGNFDKFLDFAKMALDAMGSNRQFILVDWNSPMRRVMERRGATPHSLIMKVNP